MKKIYLILFLVVIIAGLLRFYQLGVNPPSLTWDEVSWGYNAYSLGIDGKDEFGRFLPHDYLESFGDYKPPVYAYLAAVPVKLFGLNEFAVRFPSAIFGTFTVLVTFFLTKRIFYKSKNKDQIAIFSALFLALSPWHIMLSRAAFEANIASFFIISGVWAFLAGVQNKKWYLLFSAAFFALSMYTFNTARVVAPIIVLLLAVMFWKKLLEVKKQTIFAAIVGLLIFLPIFGFLLSPQAGLRFKEVNIFSDISIVNTSNQEIANDNDAWWSKIIHNRRVLYSFEYLHHYFDNLTPNFLFIKGDGNPKFSTQNVGQMYLWDIPFFVLGILFLFKKREGNWWIIPLWLLIGIVPAATARETPHALRIESSLPMFQVLAAYGFVVFWEWVKKLNSRKLSNILILTSFVLLFANFFYFYHDYLNNYKYSYSQDWEYSYKQSIEYVKGAEKNYDYIQVTKYLGRPYVYYLFYTKTKPKDFRETAIIKRDIFGFVMVTGFGKYLFPENYDYNLIGKKILYINASNAVPQSAKILKKFYLLNGKEILTAYTM